MMCENCKKNVANTYFKQTINGKSNEIFLCSECASKLGVGDMTPSFGLEDIFTDIASMLPKTMTEVSEKTCPVCGMSERDIYSQGRVGCGECYKTFQGRLAPVLGKIHGNKKHVGRRPDSAGSAVKENSLEEMKNQLTEAITTENFEQAAVLRDKIKEIEKKQGEK